MSIIGFLYSLVGVIALIGFLPQIFTLWKAKTPCLNVSITTWSIWLATWLISLTYGIVELGDTKFIIIALINVVGHTTIIALTAKNRLQYR